MKEAFTLIPLLKEKSLTISTAESCTGGLIAKTLTDVPGASAAFVGGVVSYTNEVKTHTLGVRQATIEQYTEISAPCALEMARGVRKLMQTDIGVSTTGIAGPGGGTDEHPVGTVFVAVVTPEEEWVANLALPADMSREDIRMESTRRVLEKTATLLCSGQNE